MSSKRGIYKVRYRQRIGRDGGLGPAKSCRLTLSEPNQAQHKLRTPNALVTSVTLWRKL